MRFTSDDALNAANKILGDRLGSGQLAPVLLQQLSWGCAFWPGHFDCTYIISPNRHGKPARLVLNRVVFKKNGDLEIVELCENFEQLAAGYVPPELAKPWRGKLGLR